MDDSWGVTVVISGFTVVIITLILLILMAAVWVRRKAKEVENEIIEKAKQGEVKFNDLLARGEFKTEKTAISYTASIHRLYHKAPQESRPKETGIRSYCSSSQKRLWRWPRFLLNRGWISCWIRGTTTRQHPLLTCSEYWIYGQGSEAWGWLYS